MRRVGSRAVSWLVVAAVAAMLSPVSMSYAAVLSDEVTSSKLKEADGTSGQNTNSGSGVKTGHIQDGAVTDVKITGTISGSKLGAHGHNASDVVGIISTSNLPLGTASGTVAAGDHNHDSVYQKKYAKVIVVAKSGGDYNNILDAMNSITDASSVNPYLIKVFPGIYDLGAQVLSLKSYVDIEGSGINVTELKRTLSNTENWVIFSNGCNFNEVRNITLTGHNDSTVMVNNGCYFSIKDAVVNNGLLYINSNKSLIREVKHSNPTNPYAGIQITAGDAFLYNVESDVAAEIHSNATIDGLRVTLANTNDLYGNRLPGIRLLSSWTKAILTNSSTNGALEINKNVTLRNSSVFSVNANYNPVFIANTLIDSGQVTVTNSAVVKCNGVFNSNFDTITCQ